MAPTRLPTFALLTAVVAVTLAGGACSGDGEDDPAGEPAGTAANAPPTTPEIELFVTEDRVRVEPTGIVAEDGTVLVAFDPGDAACLATQGLDQGDEQARAEAVVACVDFERLRSVVRSQLADQPALEGVDPGCLDREVDLLTDQPQELAAVLRGDENGRPVVAGAMAANCAP